MNPFNASKYLILFFLLGCSSGSDSRLREAKSQHSDISGNFYGLNHALYAVESGCLEKKKEVLVFIHGSPGSWSDYEKYLTNDSLRTRYCLIAFDRPGFGNSLPDYSLSDPKLQAEYILDSLDQFGQSHNLESVKLVLVGHSYGGTIATHLALYKLNTKVTLVLIASPMDARLEELKWYNRLANYYIIRLILPRDLVHSNDEMLPLKSQLSALENEWKETNFKIILIHGKNDSLVPFENVHFVKEKAGKNLISSIEIEDENHFLPWTKKDLIISTLINLRE